MFVSIGYLLLLVAFGWNSSQTAFVDETSELAIMVYAVFYFNLNKIQILLLCSVVVERTFYLSCGINGNLI